MMIVTRHELDAAGCGEPHCQHDHTILYLRAICHGKAGVQASYDKRTGTLKLVCKKCKAPVAEIAVAFGLN